MVSLPDEPGFVRVFDGVTSCANWKISPDRYKGAECPNQDAVTWWDTPLRPTEGGGMPAAELCANAAQLLRRLPVDEASIALAPGDCVRLVDQPVPLDGGLRQADNSASREILVASATDAHDADTRWYVTAVRGRWGGLIPNPSTADGRPKVLVDGYRDRISLYINHNAQGTLGQQKYRQILQWEHPYLPLIDLCGDLAKPACPSERYYLVYPSPTPSPGLS